MLIEKRKHDPRILHQTKLTLKNEEQKLLVTYNNRRNCSYEHFLRNQVENKVPTTE